VISSSALLPYLGTVLVLFIAPGPSVVLVVSRGVALGRSAALTAVAGNTLGLCTQLAVVVLGPGLLHDSHALFRVLKLAGALWLLYLGASSIRHRRDFAEAIRGDRLIPGTRQALVRDGWVVGITNPKGLITFTSIAPDVIHSSHGATITLALAALGAIGVLVALIADGAWALASGTMRSRLSDSPRRSERLNVAGGILMIAFGIGLAIIALG
jgi:threonine/homoserine/homoserine lactone efflux protein